MNAPGGTRYARRHFALSELPRERWRNGGGWTCPVAGMYGADGRPNWRVSVAEITGAGPFSIFEGLDRQSVMLDGGRLRLRAACPAEDVVFDGPSSLAAFPGERALVADAPSLPTRLWNVMHRRGVVRAQVCVSADQVVVLPAAAHVLVCVLGGEMELALPRCRTQGLGSGQGLHLQQLPERTLLAPCRPGSRVLVTTLV